MIRSKCMPNRGHFHSFSIFKDFTKSTAIFFVKKSVNFNLIRIVHFSLHSLAVEDATKPKKVTQFALLQEKTFKLFFKKIEHKKRRQQGEY